jgi:hypothetical protein
MPRNNGIYSPPSGTTAVSQTPISSAAYNNFVTDITADQNNPRPIIAGGTGAATAGGARTALGLGDAATRNVGTTAGTVAAGDDSRITGALPLDGSAAMTGPLTLPASTTAATSLHIPPGVDPTAPVNGDLWADSGGLRLRRSGTTAFLWDSSSLSLISKADAEAGTSTIGRVWTAERVAQAIDARVPQPSIAKAWVNFNGSGTVAINASHNVSSITDNGTGDYTINFATSLGSADYAIVVSSLITAEGGSWHNLNVGLHATTANVATTKTASAARIKSGHAGNTTSLDPSNISVVVFGA